MYDDGKGGDIKWWEQRCESTFVRILVAQMGADATALEEFQLKYGHSELLDREDFFRLLFWMKHTPQRIAAHLCHEAEGVPRELGGKAWHVFTNTLIMLSKKFGGPTS